jgi:membrane protein
MRALWTRSGLTWWELGRRIWKQMWEDEVLAHCAELAYFFLFSAFPLLLFLTTLLGYLAESSLELRLNLFQYLARVSPSQEVTALLTNTLAEISRGKGSAKLSLSLASAVWIASNGMLAVSRALNRACGLRETRPWWQRRLTAILLTCTFAALVISALALILYGSEIGEGLAVRLGIGPAFAAAWHVLQWPLILVFVVISFEMVYNYAPNLGPSPRRQWWTPGAVTGTALWLGVSFGYRLYLTRFHRYTTTYGSLGAVILLLVWFYLTAFAILMGGEVNSEIARARTEAAARRRAAARRSRPPGRKRA